MSARPIEWVIRIGRIAIEADVIAIAAEFDLPLRRLVTRLAQALELASDERGPVTPVLRDMIHEFAAVTTPRSKQNLHKL
jgi:hypothetical protein